MSKMIHFRIDDDLFLKLQECSKELKLPIQECLTIATRQFIIKNSISEIDQNKEYKFIDLFAGIGGMRLAFEEEGSHCIYSSEWDKFCQKTYYKNFGNQPDGDITQIKIENIPEHDILLVGFPNFSFNNESKDNFEKSIEKTAFYEIYRILKERRPKAFVFEYSDLIANDNKGKTLETLFKILKNLNYEYFYRMINSKNYVPQNKTNLLFWVLIKIFIKVKLILDLI